MSDKPKVAFYWCASCGGCEEAVVDLAEEILDVVAAVDIVFWPVAMDFKKSDVEAMEDGEILAAFINGAIRTTEQEEMAHLLRRKAKVLVAFGACAHLGGIPGLANLWDREAIFDTVYRTTPTTVNPDGVRPQVATPAQRRLSHPARLLRHGAGARPGQSVDYYIPGCAPTPNLIAGAVATLLSGDLPPAGTVLAPDIALCEECPRMDTKPEDLSLERVQAAPRDPHRRGDLPAGPGPPLHGAGDARRLRPRASGATCPAPAASARRAGSATRAASTSRPWPRCSRRPTTRPSRRALDSIPDPVGTFYRYGLAGSLLRRRKMTTVDA